MKCDFWCGTKLDALVKKHPELLEEFFAGGLRPAGPVLTRYQERREVPEEERGEAAALLSPYALAIPLVGGQGRHHQEQGLASPRDLGQPPVEIGRFRRRGRPDRAADPVQHRLENPPPLLLPCPISRIRWSS